MRTAAFKSFGGMKLSSACTVRWAHPNGPADVRGAQDFWKPTELGTKGAGGGTFRCPCRGSGGKGGLGELLGNGQVRQESLDGVRTKAYESQTEDCALATN